MIALQKPVNAFFSSSTAYYKPTHARHPSAPVVVRPTHTPGLLSLSKPAPSTPQRSQQTHQHPRAPRTPKGKAQRSPQPAPAQAQPVEDVKKQSPVSRKAGPASGKGAASGAPAVSPEKTQRGRQHAKPAANDKADRRSMSHSSIRSHARRLPHQPSPPMIPMTEDSSRSSVNPLRAQPYVHRDSNSNLFDPFVVNSSSDNETSDPVRTGKPIAYDAPQLAIRPSGKLARRRQAGGSVHLPSTPARAVPVPLGKDKVGTGAHPAATLARSEPLAIQRPGGHVNTARRTVWGDFPVCDDSDDVTPPTTPVRESASMPAKKAGATWQQSIGSAGHPRTAPLGATFGYPFVTPSSTPTPAQRRRNHRRVPSEGMFNMSMDEDSSSDASEELKAMVGLLPRRRATMSPMRSASGKVEPPVDDLSKMSAAMAGFYAGSVFQNSPDPDELPVPAFAA